MKTKLLLSFFAVLVLRTAVYSQCPENVVVGIDGTTCGPTATIFIEAGAQFDVTYSLKNSSGSILESKQCNTSGGCPNLAFATNVTAGTYSIQGDLNGCIRTVQSDINVVFQGVVKATVSIATSSNPSLLCEGAPFTMTATITPSDRTFQWKLLSPDFNNGNWGNAPGASGNIYNPSGGVIPGQYKVVVHNDCDQPNTESDSIRVVRIPPVGKPSIDFGLSTICKGTSSSSFTAIATNATSFTWNVTGSGNTATTGSMSNPGDGYIHSNGSVTWNAAMTSASVTVTANGCGTSQTSNEFAVASHTIATKTTIASATSTCANSPVSFTLQSPDEDVFYKLINQNGTVVSNANLSELHPDVILQAPGPGTYTVKANDAFCSALQPVSSGQTISLKTPATITIVASNDNATNVSVGTVCRGDGFKFTASGGGSYRWYWTPSDPNNEHDPNTSVGASARFPAQGTDIESGAYFLTAVEPVCQNPFTSPIYSVIQHDLPDATFLEPTGTSKKIKSTASQNFTAVPQSDHTYKWFLGSTQKASGSSNVYHASEEGNYMLTVESPDGCKKTSDPFFLDINSLPVIQVTATHTVNMPANSYTIDAQVSDSDGPAPAVHWQKLTGKNIDLSGLNTQHLLLQQLRVGNYQFQIEATDNFGETSTTTVDLTAHVPGDNYNFIRQEVVQVRGIDNITEMQELPDDSVTRSITYFDGIGRKAQQIIIEGSPTKKDIVTPFVYDTLGREVRQYLPVTIDNEGRFNENLINTNGVYANNFYNNLSDDIADDVPYSETVFENSPLNRVLEQGAPGAAWQPGTGHTIKKQYLTNAAEEVLLLTYSADTGFGSADYYEANTLSCTKTLDEHDNDVLEYTDKEGRIVCKKVKAPDGYACTYYVYDDLGNLVVVVPPEGVERILHPNGN